MTAPRRPGPGGGVHGWCGQAAEAACDEEEAVDEEEAEEEEEEEELSLFFSDLPDLSDVDEAGLLLDDEPRLSFR